MLMALQIVSALVALLHFYFLLLEMFLWTRPLGLKTFRMTPEHAQKTQGLAANQGLYNGFLAAGLVWSLLHPEANMQRQLAGFFLGCVVLAGLYGGYSVNKRIIVIQALPAAIGLLLLLGVSA